MAWVTLIVLHGTPQGEVDLHALGHGRQYAEDIAPRHVPKCLLAFAWASSG